MMDGPAGGRLTGGGGRGGEGTGLDCGLGGTAGGDVDNK